MPRATRRARASARHDGRYYPLAIAYEILYRLLDTFVAFANWLFFDVTARELAPDEAERRGTLSSFTP